jgi:hypothetical protein
MSALRAATVTAVKPKARTGFRILNRVRSGKVGLAALAMIGILVVQGLNLAMSAATGAGAYEISRLKIERANLSTQADIIGSEVNSLASNQNLVNVAHALGMVSNVNPVFLRLADSSVIGKPRRAQANERTVSKNLVPNAAMTTDTNVSKLDEVSDNTVLSSTSSSVGAHSGTIQASPTY